MLEEFGDRAILEAGGGRTEVRVNSEIGNESSWPA